MRRTLGHDPKDIGAGLLFLGFGLAGITISLIDGYQIGSLRHMGEGFLPNAYGAMLVAIGVALIVRGAMRQGEELGKVGWAAMALVTGATVLFGLTVTWLGLAPAVFMLVLLASFASIRFRWSWVLALALFLAAFSVVVFIMALGVSLPIMPHVIGR